MKKFYLKQKVFSFKDRYKIFDENEVVVFHCEGRLFSLRKKMEFLRTETDEVLYITNKRVLSLFPTYDILDTNENKIAVVNQKLAFLKKVVDVKSDLGDFQIEGSFWAHSFSINKDNDLVAEVKKKRISWGDSYEISIHDENITEFLLFAIVIIDSIFHRNDKKHN